MKKIFALLLMVVMSVTLLAGCGTDPIQADLENFLNVEMTEVNADYTKITEEVGKWEAYEDDAQILASINDTLLPLVESSLTALKDINPETEEVQQLLQAFGFLHLLLLHPEFHSLQREFQILSYKFPSP